jgi:hypothetical protein
LATEEIAIDDALDRDYRRTGVCQDFVTALPRLGNGWDLCAGEDTFGATEFIGKKLTLVDADSPGTRRF